MTWAAAKYVYRVELFNTWVGKGVEYGIFLMLAIMLIEGVRRYFLNDPTTWSVELGKFVLGAYFILGGAYVYLIGGHVRMDALYSRWSAKRRAITDIATVFAGIIYLAILWRGAFDNVLFAVRFNQISSTPWGPPLAPIKIIMAVGIVLLLLQVIASLIRDVSIFRGRPIP